MPAETIPQEDSSHVSAIPFGLLFALAVLGTFASGFLAYRHILLLSQTDAVVESFLCRAHGNISCDAVLLTPYAVVFDVVSSAVLGLMGFAFVLWLTASSMFIVRLRKTVITILTLYFSAAIGFSIYFIYLMLFEIDSICPWCIVVHAVNFTSLTILVILLFRNKEDSLFSEDSTLVEQAYFVIGGVLLSGLVFFASGMIEYNFSFRDVEERYFELADNPVVERALLEAAAPAEVPISDKDPVFGSPTAPYPIIIFTDFACPACAKLDKWLRILVLRNKSTLKLVYKNYPLSTDCHPNLAGNLHPMACQAGRAAYAAFLLGGNEAFDAYTELLFRNRKRLKKEPWLEFAEKLNLDKERFQNLIKDGSEADKKIQKDLKLGLELDIMGTPQLVFEKRKIPAKYRGPELINLMQDLIRTYHPDQAKICLRGLI